jgi:hypothetical protein
MSKIFKPEIERKTIALSTANHLILKKIGHQLECDSMDQTISKILAKIPSDYKINVNTETNNL